jgi:pyrimidine-specific ribonucleoside hydrolase
MSRPAVTLAIALMVALVCGCGGTGATESPADGRTPVVVDTDLSTDDILALLYLAGREDVQLRAVTVSGTGLARCPVGAANALALLAAAGRGDVPVACGRKDPLAGFNAFPPDWRDRADTLFGLGLPAATRRPEPGGATALLRRALGERGPKVTVLSLAPLTDTAELLAADPEVRSRIAAVVAMGGAVDVPGNIGAGHERAEYNLWVDPAAAAQVLDSGVPVMLVPLDATNQVPVTNAFAGALKAQRRAGPGARLAWRLFELTGMFAGGQYFWDVLAAAAITTPGVLDVRTRRLAVDTAAGPDQGGTRSDPDGARVKVAVGADRAAFEHDLLATLTGRTVRVPQPREGEALTYDGRSCRWPGGPTRGPAGPVSFDTEATSDRAFAFAIVALHERHTIADLRAALADAGGRLEPSSWLTVEWTGVTPPRSRMTWIGKLTTGRKALACVDEASGRATIATPITVTARR